jgi:hypothetical protein
MCDMKKWITLWCTSAILFTACSKDDLQANQQENASTPVGIRSAENNYYASNWEQMKSWNHTDSSGYRLYYSEKINPELTSDVINGGVVMSYAKINMTDPNYTQFNNPSMMPFYFLPPWERPNLSFYWYEEADPGKLRVFYRTKSKDDLPAFPEGKTMNDFQFRYFVITREFLDSHGLTPSDVKNHYTYQQLVNLLGVDN